MSRGFGLVAKEDIPAGGLIIEYCGEMITDAECTRRLNETELTGNKEYYFFKIADDLVIDAGPIGNNARFLNHSCDVRNTNDHTNNKPTHATSTSWS